MHQDYPQLPVLDDRWQATLGWQPTPEQQQKFQLLYQDVLVGNRQFNLTRITEPDDFWEKHLWDSLSGIQYLLGADSKNLDTQNNAQANPHNYLQSINVIDIGTGAGFPGLPVAIVLPDASLMLLDSTHKKMTFVNQLIQTLQLENVGTITGRAEQIGQMPEHRAFYHLALVRAVSSVTVCAEYTLPFLRLGGKAVFYRGQWTAGEEKRLSRALIQLGGEIEDIQSLTTPLTGGIRHCLKLKKIADTPDVYPRPVGLPNQYPLGQTNPGGSQSRPR